MVTKARYPTAPQVTRRDGSLLDTATVTDDYAWLVAPDGTVADLFDSFNCLQFGADPGPMCQPSSKTFDDVAEWLDGFSFAAYGGVRCSLVGLDRERMASEVRRVFETGESTAVERAMVDLGLAGAVDLTPAAGPVKPSVGVGILEGHAASNYVGVPTLHLPVVVASILSSVKAFEKQGSRLFTQLGSKVVAGAGYDYPNLSPAGAEPAAGEKWLYATGEVFVGRGDVQHRQVVDHTDNDALVLAERPYIGSIDCYTAAVRVSVNA